MCTLFMQQRYKQGLHDGQQAGACQRANMRHRGGRDRPEHFFLCVTVKQEEHKLSILSSSGRSKHVVNVYDVSTGIDH